MNPETQIGRYAIIDRLGAGGMAEVFRCRQTGLGGFDKTVVIKRILPHLASEPEFINMFLDEARKVLDFGVARARGRLANSQVGTLKGKLRYMAPEQIVSEDGSLDARADVYSLGVCLYLGTVGRLPFRGETDAA